MMFVNTAEAKRRRGGGKGGAMDDFYWIHVDTGNLRAFSKEYRTRADVLQEAGKGIRFAIQTVLDHMPDYDGRMQPAARADAEDFYARAWRLHLGFTEDAGFLQKTAEAFEDVDGRTVRIFEECRGITSTACLIDAQGTPGLGTTTTEAVVANPDGSVSTITIVKTLNPDGSITTYTTIKNVRTLDAQTASDWNKCEQIGTVIISGIAFLVLGKAVVAALAAAGYITLSTIADGAFSVGDICLDIAQIMSPPPDKWCEGDTIISTTTIVTTEQPNPPETPYPETPPLGPDITTETVVTDANGDIKHEDVTGVDPTGAVKSGTPPITS
jgi:hypothetical protein